MGIIKAGTTCHPAHPNARTFEGPRGLNGYLMLETQPDRHYIELQESSCFMAGETEGPFIWLRVGKTPSEASSAHMHESDARALRDALNVALGDEK